LKGLDYTEAVKVDYNSKVLFGEINLFPNPVSTTIGVLV